MEDFEYNKIINPYDEKIMSLNKESFYDNNLLFDNECKATIKPIIIAKIIETTEI